MENTKANSCTRRVKRQLCASRPFPSCCVVCGMHRNSERIFGGHYRSHTLLYFPGRPIAHAALTSLSRRARACIILRARHLFGQLFAVFCPRQGSFSLERVCFAKNAVAHCPWSLQLTTTLGAGTLSAAAEKRTRHNGSRLWALWTTKTAQQVQQRGGGRAVNFAPNNSKDNIYVASLLSSREQFVNLEI